MFRKNLKLFVKILFSLGILWFLLQKLNFSESFKIISNFNPYIFVLTVALYLIGQYISSIKWGFISNDLGFRFLKKDYVDYYFTGMFFNLFLPTSVGGDVVKGYYLCRQEIPNKKNKALISVFWDRLTGAMTMILLSAAGLFWSYKKLPLYLNSVILLAFLGVFVFIVALPLVKKLNLRESIRVFAENLSKLNANRRLWGKILLYSMLFHFIVIIIHFILAKSSGINIPFSFLLILYPITAIAGFLPVSLNGIGVREGTYVYLLSLISISYEQAFAYSILWFLVMTVSSLFSVVFYLKSKQQKLSGIENQPV